MPKYRLTFTIEVEADNKADAREIADAIMDGGIGGEAGGAYMYEVRISPVRAVLTPTPGPRGEMK